MSLLKPVKLLEVTTRSADILETLLDRMPDSYQKTIGFPTYDILAAASAHFAQTQTIVEENKKKLDLENLSGSELDRHIFPRAGLIRKQATFASGIVRVRGNGTVNQGDLFESGGGVRFVAIETVPIIEEGDVRVSCLIDGIVGNLPIHSVTQIPVTIPGITGVTNLSEMRGGYDEETDEAYLKRFYIKIQTPPTSGNIYHYQSWALEIAGVGEARVFPLGHGDNTVDVVLVDSNGQPADDSLVQKVQEYIDPTQTGEGYGVAPIGATCYVSAATAHPVDISVSVLPQPSAAQDEVKAEIQKAISHYFGEASFTQDYISYAAVVTAIYTAPGVDDCSQLRLDGGVDDITVSRRECATVGNLVISFV